MLPVSLKLRLALSSAGSLLCTAHNFGEFEATLQHSPTVHHTELMIFDKAGIALPFVDRMKNRVVDPKDKKGHGVTIVPGEKAHLSHSRIIFSEKGNWGVNWGIKKYHGLKPGIYRFVVTHPQAECTNIVAFDIPALTKN
jgi:hypothetical protein